MSEPNTPTPDSQDERIGRILNDFHDRRARGETVTVEGLLAAHPDLAADLKPYLEMLGDFRSEGDRIKRLVADGVLRESDDPAYQATLGDYKTVGFIGRGGMGIVLKAFEENLGRTVALKILRPELADDKASLQRFTREAKAAGMLRHPNIVTVYAVGEQHGVNYIAMEYIEGPTLADVIHEQAPLPTETIRGLFGEVLLGLAAAHESGIIHRDIKSANMLLDGGAVKPIRAGFCEAGAAQDVNEASAARDVNEAGAARGINEAGDADTPANGTGPTRPGSDSIFNLRPSSFRLKIADFGLALMAATQTRITLPDSSPGTPEYMSPEQARGDEDIDPRADLYSAGIVLYEMLTGRTPFRADTPSVVIHRILLEDPADPRTLNENADPHLASLAMRLMAKRPEDRFASASDAIEALEAGERVQSLERRRKRRRLGYCIVVISLLVAVFVYVVRCPGEIAGVRVSPSVPTLVEVRYADRNKWERLHEFGPDHLLYGAVLIDADGEGKQLVVAALQEPMDGKHLFAFDAEGNEVWGLEVSSKRRWPDNESTVLSSCTGLLAADCDRRLGEELVLSVVDTYGYRSRILVIDPRTQEIRSELWHMGHIAQVLATPDFLGTGRPAIIACGMNNHIAYITRQRNGKEQPLASFKWVPVVMVLAPEDLAGEQLLAPHTSTSRLDGVPTVLPRAYACLDRPPADNVIDVSGAPGCIRTPEESEVAILEPIFLLPCPKDGSKSCIMLPFMGPVESKGGASLLVDSNLEISQVRLSTAPWEGQDQDYWRRHWHIIIQNGEYVKE